MQIIVRSLLSYLILLSACGTPTTGERWVLVDIPSWPTRVDAIEIKTSYGNIAGWDFILRLGTPGFAFPIPAGPPAQLDITARVIVGDSCVVSSTHLTRNISDDTRFPVVEKLSLPPTPDPTFPSEQNQTRKPFRIRCNSWLPISPEQPDVFKATKIWGQNDSNIWIAGASVSTSQGGYTAAIYHWNGSSTQRHLSASDGWGTEFTSIWGSSAGAVWTASSKGEMFKWDGLQWSRFYINPPNEAVYETWGTSESDIWVAGNSSLFHWNGNSWWKTRALLSDFGPAQPNIVFQGLDSTHFWVANAYTPKHLMFWNGVSWQNQCGSGPEVASPWRFAAASDGSAWTQVAAGFGRWDGVRWNYWGKVKNFQPYAIFAFDENNAIAVGFDNSRLKNALPSIGKTVVWNGVTWNENFSESTYPLTALWASDPEHIYATDTKARLLRCVTVAR